MASTVRHLYAERGERDGFSASVVRHAGGIIVYLVGDAEEE